MFDDFIVGPQCEDFYDDRWEDEDWGWDDPWPLGNDDYDR